MDVFTLAGKIKMEGSEAANSALNGVKKNSENLQKAMKVTGAAFTALGAAGLKMSSDARKLNASLTQTAMGMGTSTKETRRMALEMTNVTFPLEEVTKSMDLLTRAGVKDEEQMKSTAIAFDTLGDAVGLSASVVTDKMITAMKTYRLSADEVANNTDKMTYMVRNSTLSLEDFSSVVGYVTPDLVDMGLTMDDTIALLGIMEGKGVSGAVATREFRSAITEATNEQKPLQEALGVTQAEMDAYKKKLEGAKGMTNDYAEAANQQYGVMDKLKQKWSEVTLQIGSLLTPLEPVLGAMTALGPVMMGLSTSMGQAAIKTVAHTVSMIAHKAISIALTAVTWTLTIAQRALTAAMNMTPIGWLITAIGLLIAAGIALWRNWDTVKVHLENTWDAIKTVFAVAIRDILEHAIQPLLNALASIIDFGANIVGFFNSDWGDAMRSAADSVRGAIDGAIEWTHKLEDNAQAQRAQRKAVNDTADSVDNLSGEVRGGITALDDYETAMLNTAEATAELDEAGEDYLATIKAIKAEQEAAKNSWVELLAVMTPAVEQWDELGISAQDAMTILRDEFGVAIERLAKHLSDAGIEANDWRYEWQHILKSAGVDTEDFFGVVASLVDNTVAKLDDARDSTKGFVEELGDASGSIQSTIAQVASLISQMNTAAGIDITSASSQGSTGSGPAAIHAGSLIMNLQSNLENRNKESLMTNALKIRIRDLYQAAGSTEEYQALYTQIWGAFMTAASSGGLPQFANGGVIREPTLLFGLRSQMPYAIAGEQGREFISPDMGGGVHNSFNIAELVVREEADVDKIARELYRMQQRRSFS